MEKSFYEIAFNNALKEIQFYSDPRAKNVDLEDLNWRIVNENDMLNFSTFEFAKYNNLTFSAKHFTLEVIQKIIKDLAVEYNLNFETINGFRPTISVDNKDKAFINKIRFVIKEKDKKELLIFKEKEDSPIWKVAGQEPKIMQDLMKYANSDKCKYIYFMYDNAFLQFFKDDKTDKHSDTDINSYSLKWFFENYFNISEWENFLLSYKNYLTKINEFLGYIMVKSLTPNSMVNFKRVVENGIIKFEYKSEIKTIYTKDSKKYYLSPEDYNLLQKQFINDKAYLLLLGKSDFAESFITSEWLYRSMKKAKAVDLTVIGMGYLKSIEQLMYSLILLHKNENREIKKANASVNERVVINDDSIANNLMDTTLGPMANFYKYNLDIFRNDISDKAKKYIIQYLFKYKDIRNGYFHKDNIHTFEKIDEIKKETYNLMFLLLSGYNYRNKDRYELGEVLSSVDTNKDYYKLCEYVNFHHDMLYTFVNVDGKELYFIGQYDKKSKLVNNSFTEYSGVYFRELGKNTPVFTVEESGLPYEIYLSKFSFGYECGKIKIEPTKVEKVYSNGIFVGTPITEEIDTF